MYTIKAWMNRAEVYYQNMVATPALLSMWLGTDEAEAAISEFAAAHPDVRIAELAEDHAAKREMRKMAQKIDTANEHVYIRFGKLPRCGQSRNHATGEMEAGVSVYNAAKVGAAEYIIDMRNVDAGSGLFIAQNRDPYLVTGSVAGTGSDGEPLLTNCKAKKLTNYSIKFCC